MRVLVTNDDGFDAPGLAVLARGLPKLDMKCSWPRLSSRQAGQARASDRYARWGAESTSRPSHHLVSGG